jgi:predicted RNA binding protein YcfA (HicA-like mRNA interferase family)
MRFLEIERIIKKDGWKCKAVKGSHYQPTPPQSGRGMVV